MSRHSTSSRIKLISHCRDPAKVHPEGKAGLRKAGTILCFDILALVFQEGSLGSIHLFSKSREVWGESLLVFRLLIDDPNFV